VSKILVVEDSRTQAEQLRLILEAEGFAVEVARDGHQGIERLNASTFDLVITDVCMPGLSGYELCREIKADPCHARVPVVLLTTLNGPTDIVQGLECGADNFITKPYRPEYLAERVRRILADDAPHADGGAPPGKEGPGQTRSFPVTSNREQILDLLLATCEDVARANLELKSGREALEAAQRAEETLRASEELYRSLVETSPDAILLIGLDRRVRMANRQALALFGYDATEMIGRDRLELIAPESRESGGQNWRSVLEAGGTANVEYRVLRKDGSRIDAEVNASLIVDGRGTSQAVLAVIRDVTARKRLEAQFLQAQKMEAVGRLAGGIAHDFNNLLCVINGYAEMLLSDAGQGQATRQALGEVLKAGERAASLTRQLLVFSRQQVVAPQVLNLNAVVADTERMLRRLIGEDVELTCVMEESLGRVKADAGQVEQVLLNLAVNARDAMPQGGKLTIETMNVELDECYVRTRPNVRPGRYVLLAVSDTGCGMDEATQARIFEPFFTTKEPGKGTGLGLATIFGIVQQASGHLAVYSELGRGTAFKVYLPSVEEAVSAGPSSRPGLPARLHGNETILLAEDDAAVRAMTRLVLQTHGYTVLEASNGDEALLVSESHAGRIALVISDVVMPGMSGRELVDRLAVLRPAMRALYLSGYTNDAVVRHGVLEAKTAFLQKPFGQDDLPRKVREVLDGEGCGAATGSWSASSPTDSAMAD
jgi:two-component system, cell cycle sensor histidine kinase and response regulator CckA